MKLESWLKEHGLEEYASAFASERIELGDLTELTDDDIASLGLPLGPRRRLQKAIRELANKEAPASAHVAAKGIEGSVEIQTAWSRQPGDRRPVTLLFADVTGSTSLTECLDPEDAHRVLYGAVQQIGLAVESHRGTVCRFMGDGLMAMFGVPTAFEAHTHEACLAALDIHANIAAYSTDLARQFEARLEVRVGLHAGEVVALQVGEGERREWDASGPAVPLAARMEQCATPGTTLMTASTFDSVSREFQADALPAVRAKGFSEPIDVVRLMGQRKGKPSEHEEGEVPFVGRRAERAQIFTALDTCAQAGFGQALFVRGEPGIGKTRLTQEIALEASARGFTLHRILVLDFGGGKGQTAMPALIRSLLGLADDASKDSRRLAAAKAIDSGVLTEEYRAHLNDLLDLPQAKALSVQLESMDLDKRLEARGALISTLLAKGTERGPSLLVIEDLHWADQATLTVLARLLQAAAASPVVFLMTSRQVGDPLTTEWTAQLQGVSLLTIDLVPLNEADARSVAETVAGLDEEFSNACLLRAEGNPLFLLHLLRMANAGAPSKLPTSVQTLVTVSLDRLHAADRRAVQAAAVLGQRFKLSTLEAIVGQGSFECSRLVAAHMVRPDSDAYMFTHALVREGVLASLLRDERHDLHLAAANWFEGRDGTLYAVHLDHAEDERAGAAYLSAAREQAQWHRYGTCIQLLERGIELARNDPDRSAMHFLLGEALSGRGKFVESVAAYRRVLDLEDDPKRRCHAMIPLSAACRNTGEYEAGLSALSSAEEEARRGNLLPELVEVHFRRSSICLSTLDRDGAERDAHRARELAVETANDELTAMA